MLRKAVAYDYFITVSDIWKLLANMEYDPNDSDHYFLVDGAFIYTAESSIIQEEDRHIFPTKRIENTFTGIGIFRNWDDKFPVLIIDHVNRVVRVFDPKWMKYASARLHKPCQYISITFEQAFEECILFRKLLIDMANEKSGE